MLSQNTTVSTVFLLQARDTKSANHHDASHTFCEISYFIQTPTLSEGTVQYICMQATCVNMIRIVPSSPTYSEPRKTLLDYWRFKVCAKASLGPFHLICREITGMQTAEDCTNIHVKNLDSCGLSTSLFIDNHNGKQTIL